MLAQGKLPRYNEKMDGRGVIDINKALKLAAAALAAAIVLGTIAALAAGKRPGADWRKSDPQSLSQLDGGQNAQSEFKEFETFRIRLLPDENSGQAGSVLTLTPWLSYTQSGSAFYEELVAKKRLFSSYIMEYFSTKTKNALLSIGEKKVKQALLERFNGQLSLGKIDAIYFDDYIFLD